MFKKIKEGYLFERSIAKYKDDKIVFATKAIMNLIIFCFSIIFISLSNIDYRLNPPEGVVGQTILIIMLFVAASFSLSNSILNFYRMRYGFDYKKNYKKLKEEFLNANKKEEFINGKRKTADKH